jgi:hypothetical protein
MDLKKKIVQFESHHFTAFIVFQIILLVVIVLLIKPALLGYKFSNQFEEIGMSGSDYLQQMDEIETRLAISEATEQGCENSKDNVLREIKNERQKTEECKDDIQVIEAKLANLNNEFRLNTSITRENFIDSIQKNEIEVRDLRVENNRLTENFDTLAGNSANNICCKARVDDSSIDSYSTSGNRIACGSGRENVLSC